MLTGTEQVLLGMLLVSIVGIILLLCYIRYLVSEIDKGKRVAYFFRGWVGTLCKRYRVDGGLTKQILSVRSADDISKLK
jgi:hypothetical protein